jgi:hypothetical protein
MEVIYCPFLAYNLFTSTKNPFWGLDTNTLSDQNNPI